MALSIPSVPIKFYSVHTSVFGLKLLDRFHCHAINRAQLFEGRLALNPRLNLTRVPFSCV